MKRRNSFFAILLIVLSCCLLVGCNQEEQPTESTKSIVKTDLSPECAGRYNKTVANTDITADFCACNGLGVILNNSGSASTLSHHTLAKIPEKTYSDMDRLSRSYAEFMKHFIISDTYYFDTIKESEKEYAPFETFVDTAEEVFSSSDFSVCENILYDAEKSVIVGINKPFALTFGSSYSYSDMMLVASELFGYNSKNNFVTYAKTLVSTYGGAKDKTVEELRLSLDGAIYTENGSYVMPYVVKSNLSKDFALCLILNEDGVLSLWIGDMESAAKTVDLSDTQGTSSFSLYGRCSLFETASGYYEFSYEGTELMPGSYATMKLSTSDGLSRTITIMLLPEYAPQSVENFISYADEGYYDGTVIHRIVTDGCLQGGGYVFKNGFRTKALPEGKSGIEGEFTNNGHPENVIGHCPGTISMARTSEVNSGTSQFFLCFDYYPSWDGEYAGFGFMIYKEDIEFVKMLGQTTDVNSGSYPTTRRITIEEVKTFTVDDND